jgi:DNA-binding CsgD family transcriptional regulator
MAITTTSSIRSMCCYRAGRLLAAESDAATALELAPEIHTPRSLVPIAVAYAVLSGIERLTPLDSVQALAFAPSLNSVAQVLSYTQLAWARGELCLCLERWEQALSQFAECDRSDPAFGGANPSMLPWREGAAQAHLRLGDRRTARQLTAEAVRRAEQFGARRALGLSLRSAALVEEGPARIAGLRQAAAMLETVLAPLELARVRCDLGAALRAAGQRNEARTILDQAHALAKAIGAVRIADRAAEELAAAGVRPRREPTSGLAALTPSERRVAELAAAGQTNREIAQSLFVTEKTVETHLGHVYDKLSVRSRRKLPDALAPTAPAAIHA